MFQFPGFPAHTYLIQHALHGSSPWGFPHSDIRGSKLICSSPRLIAACHVLHRLPMPRHPPYALLRLNYLQQFVPASLVLACKQELLCSILAVLLAKLFLLPFTEKPDLLFREVSFPSVPSCFPLLCLSCMSHMHSFRIHMMILSYSVFNEHPTLIGFDSRSTFRRSSVKLDKVSVGRFHPAASGLKWTRTTDLALIRRAL